MYKNSLRLFFFCFVLLTSTNQIIFSVMFLVVVVVVYILCHPHPFPSEQQQQQQQNGKAEKMKNNKTTYYFMVHMYVYTERKKDTERHTKHCQLLLFVLVCFFFHILCWYTYLVLVGCKEQGGSSTCRELYYYYDYHQNDIKQY